MSISFFSNQIHKKGCIDLLGFKTIQVPDDAHGYHPPDMLQPSFIGLSNKIL